MADLFNSLLEGLQSAVTTAGHLVETQHLDEIQEFFETDSSGRKIAKTVTIWIRSLLPGAASTDLVPLEVPLFTLVPLSTIKLKEIKVCLKCRIADIQKPDPKAKGRAARPGLLADFSSGWFGRKNSETADVEVTFVATDPPEGLVRVNWELVKRLGISESK